jgi:hypothetical protein
LFPLPGKNKIILHPLNEKNMTGIDTWQKEEMVPNRTLKRWRRA